MISFRKLFKNSICSVLCVAFLSPAVIAAGDREGWHHFKDEGSHNEVFKEFAKAEQSYSKALKLANASNSSAAERSELTARLATVMLWQGKFEQAEPHFNEVLKIIPRLKASGNRNEDFFSCVDALSNAYYERILGRNRIAGIQHSIRLIDTAFGDTYPELNRELVNLSYTYLALGMNREALTFANRAHSIAKKDKSEKGQIHQWKVASLVGACRKAVGDWNGARNAFVMAVYGSQKSPKGFSMTAASAKAQLAIIEFHFHKKEESKRLLKEAEIIYFDRLKGLEGKRRSIADAGLELLPLAEAYIAFHEYQKAEPICRKAIQWTSQVFGPQDPNLIKQYRVHGFVLGRLGRAKEAAKQEAAAHELARLYNTSVLNEDELKY
jgi:tetratricopeptide (TPR) repeat protein